MSKLGYFFNDKKEKVDVVVVEGSFNNIGAEGTGTRSINAEDLASLGFDTNNILKYQCVGAAWGVSTSSGDTEPTQWNFIQEIKENSIYPLAYINSNGVVTEMLLAVLNPNNSSVAKLFYRFVFIKVA